MHFNAQASSPGRKDLIRAAALNSNASKTPFDRTRCLQPVKVSWDESKLGINARQVMLELREGEPRIVVLRANPGIKA